MASNLAQTKETLRLWLTPRPLSESLARDAFHIVMILAIQCSILPSLTGDRFYIDLLTPWMIFIFVNASPWKILVLSAFAAFGLETHLSVPAGLYFCAYLVFAMIVIVIRNHLSWRRLVSWLTMFSLFSLWVMGLETFFSLLKVQDTEHYEPLYFAFLIPRFVVAVGFGLFMLNKLGLMYIEDKDSESEV